MLKEVLSASALIVVVLLVRAIFKNRVPKRMLYALWLVVLLKLCLPGTLVSLPVLPAEDAAVPAQSAERPVQTAPVIQRPAQTVTKPQTPAQQPVSPVQETAKPAAKPLTTAQILQIAWFSGSALLGLWLFGAWAVFTIRLHRNRRFLGKRGGTCIYVSGAVKSPCLAGLIPAVYLTEDVLQADEAELILRHELTHLRHLDFLWSLCRTAAVTVYWWNPFIWLAAICSKRDAELACDEAVAAKLPESKRLAYARAILAQAPRKASALSLAGPSVKERILFLTKKQRTSVLCVVLALLLVVSATGCSFAELTRREAEQAAPAEEETQPKTEPQAEAVPEPTAEITQPERTSLEERLPIDEAARAAWLDFADTWRLDYLPVFSHGAAPASTSEYLMWVFSRNMDALKEQGYMTKSDVETEIRAHFEVENLTHEGLTKAWNFDGETYTAVPGGVKDRPLARLDSVLTENIGGKQIYYVQYCLMGNGNLLDDVEWSRCRDEIVSGEAPDLSELWAFTLVFTMQDGEPVFLSHTELPLAALSSEEIWQHVHEKLDDAPWAQNMTPEYEEAVRAFQLADSKRSNQPGDVSQWPHYYSAFVDYFSGMNADLHYLDADAVWTMDLSEDGQMMIVTMTRGDASLTLSYSLQTQEISSDNRLATTMTLTVYDSNTPLQASEFTLPRGLRFGMSYDEAYWLCGDAVSDVFTGEVGRSFTCEGYTYSFGDDDILYYVMIRSTSGESDSAPTVRGIRLGDSIDSVFDKLPCTDRELKQWAMQTVYDDGAGHSAGLEFVAGSFYSLRLYTPEGYVAAITFARTDNTVKYIDLSAPEM